MLETSIDLHESSLGTNALLQNVPSPVGITAHTLARDYDKRRFFLPMWKGAQLPTRTNQHIQGDASKRLWDTFKGIGLRLEVEEVFEHNMLSIPDEAERIAQALRSWVCRPEPQGCEAIFQFVIHQKPISQDILRFCSREAILQYLSVAVDLIERCFSSVQKLELQQEQDPDTEEEWLVFEVTIRGEVDDVLGDYDKYTDAWVSLVPWPERSKIRLSYHII